ncbi:monodechloroaminopyrrolnitrin synthase PrnB family protein, partial [Kitasatospora sp. MBT63]|uniref:monodechloroaminopyrrolnitrin synthase PrnB family protein n=1 Tax=Kitasatospora sp. MBT63 TaxID=1444768 RepID=UPI0006911DA5
MELDSAFCAAVARRDPLAADPVLAALPALNARADTVALAGALDGLATAARDTRSDRAALPDRLAAVRDLGMLLGSLRRHGVEPLDAVPAAEPVLLRLGRSTGMAPRDTVLHYGVWNPAGPRRRLFTGAPEEHTLIDSVRTGAPAVERAALELARVLELPPDGAAFADGCETAARHLAVLPAAVAEVARSVDPAAFFMARLRPYMEDVRVGGRPWFGPAAAHLPLHLIDRLLWSGDRPDPEHLSLQEELLDFGLPEWTLLHRRQTGRPTVTTLLVRALESAGPRPGPQLRRSAAAVTGLLRTLLAFRGRHLRLVRAAYTADAAYGAGSAGAAPETVRLVL